MKIRSKKKTRKALKITAAVLLPVIFAAAVLCNNYIPRDAADIYCQKVFPYLSIPMQSFNMFFQFSLTENVVVCGVPLLIIGIIIWLVFLIKKILSKGALTYLYKSYRNVLILGIVMAICFQAMHGVNYRRTRVTDELDFISDELTFEDYCEALQWAYVGMIEARNHLGEDYNGVAHMQESFENSATFACSLIDSFSDKYNIPLSRNYVRAKPVSMSHYWSYTHIVGMYDPFLAEANINTDYMGVNEFPITLCHELCHAKGYASETDCNILSTLACCSSSRADFRYAGYYEIFWNLYYVAEDIAKATGQTVPQYPSTSEMAPVYRDARASAAYWRRIDAEVEDIRKKLGIDIAEASNNANDAFLKSNGEKGVESYNVPDSVYVRFYLTHVKGTADA